MVENEREREKERESEVERERVVEIYHKIQMKRYSSIYFCFNYGVKSNLRHFLKTLLDFTEN